ncbi:MAG: 50S ribosomal protein L4 [Planctomycetes bacterium]|nr:50S ribosomal protein L4 [Planctomycetota bacterium]
MTEVSHWTESGVGKIDLDSRGLGEIVRLKLLREAVLMYEANQRQGTHSTKTRSETAYTGHKPYKQKGTGNARRGDRNSPILRGGGIIHGPRPRDYSYAMPRRALRAALRSALLGKLRDGEVCAMARPELSTPSTRKAAGILAALGCAASAIIVTVERDEALLRSFRNLPRVHVTRACDLNAFEVLFHRNLVIVDGAWDALTERLGKRLRQGKHAAVEAGSES